MPVAYAPGALRSVPRPQRPNGLQRPPGLREVHPIVPGEHPEHQVEALLARARRCSADPLRDPPRSVPRQSSMLPVAEQPRTGRGAPRVVVVGVEVVDPQVLVVADELRPVVGEHPPVAAGHDELRVREVGEAQQHRPLPRLRPRPQVRAGLGDQGAGVRAARRLDLGRIVVAERVEQQLLVGPAGLETAPVVSVMRLISPPSSSAGSRRRRGPSMPSSWAFASFEPAPGPATT